MICRVAEVSQDPSTYTEVRIKSPILVITGQPENGRNDFSAPTGSCDDEFAVRLPGNGIGDVKAAIKVSCNLAPAAESWVEITCCRLSLVSQPHNHEGQHQTN